MARLEHRLSKYDLEQNFDLAIIGGGINGAGVARDAAQRGLKVILLEKNDFASGCSSHSTRLIHGGLRYLEHFEFSLVKESLLEREILLNNYPHLVSPINLFIPVYKNSKTPLWKLNIGMTLYDMLSANKSLENYKSISKKEIQELEMHIEDKDLNGGVYYQDGQVPFTERLVLENILSAKQDGAVCINHAEVTEIHCSQIHGKYFAHSLKFKDLINQKRPVTIHAKNIINMAGPWVDKVNINLQNQANGHINSQVTVNQLIGGTKGSHILVKKFIGAPNNFGIYKEAQKDKRPFFITPFQIGSNDEYFLIGTTDLFLNEHDNLDQLHVSENEIDYLLEETNFTFPEANLTKDDIVNTFIGVRPLPKSNSKQAGTISRRHFVKNHKKENIENYYSVVGGKLTTFRNLAKEIVDIFSMKPCRSHEIKTLNSLFSKNESFYDYIREKTKEYTLEYEIEASTVIHLILLYGSNAIKLLEMCRENPLLKQKIDTNYADIEAQIVYAIRHEEAYSIEDILKRRVSIGLLSNQDLFSVKKTIQYHINEEFELHGRNIDKIFQKYLFENHLAGETL